MFDQSPLKKLLILLASLAAGFAIVVGGVLLLSRLFDPAVEARGAEPAVAQSAVAQPGIVQLAAAPAPAGTNPVDQAFHQQVRPLLVKYCFDCHGDGSDKGDFTFDKFTTFESIQLGRDDWTKVSDLLHQRAMPPEKKPQPTDEERKLITEWIKASMDYCDCTGPRDPGRVTIRRLNRNEYNNTIRDLLGVTDFNPAADFPADDTGYGFDNIADVLTMSPLLAEKYLAAAEQVIDKALPVQEPPGPRLVKIRAAEMDATGGAGAGERASRVLFAEAEIFKQVEVPVGGKHKIRVRAGAEQAGDELAKMLVRIDGQELLTTEVEAKRRDPKTFEMESDLSSGSHRVSVSFTNDFYQPQGPEGNRDRNLHVYTVELEGPFDVAPSEPPAAFRNVFIAHPGEGVSDEQVAAKVLERFAGRAYRRPTTAEEVASLVELFKLAREQGESYEQAVKVALTGVLVSPSFLFRIEEEKSDNPDESYRISDYELATRLSYFLWSSMPDDELFTKAASGELSQPEVLKAQVRRMIRDPKSAALVENFTGQWLELRNLERATIDRGIFPEFDEALRADMLREAELFFETVVKEDRSVLDLLNGDYTFINERLARHYGIDGVQGEEFRRVSLDGTRRGGVLTMAGVLTVTAMPTRTSPVKRGKFVLEQILGTPPPAAPPDIPALPENDQDATAASLRERFEKHREDPTCASCHARMDPIGFAMENFDAIGRWREMDGAFTIDASGKFPDGATFNGPVELRGVLVEQKTDFVRCVTEKLLTYALGRGMTLADRCTVRDIAAAVEEQDYRFLSLVDAIVASDAFQKRRARRGEG